jgi:hypothetical protein
MTNTERTAKITEGVRVLTERHLEAYLFDDEILQLLATSVEKGEKFGDLQAAKQAIISKQIEAGKPANHIKFASGQMRSDFARILGLQNAGKTTGAFMRDVLAPLVKPGTKVYERLFADIFD